MHGLLWVLHTYLLPFSWSYGLCIVLLTVIVRGLMFPISRRQAMNARDMQEKMGRLAPELKKLKEKYKDDFTQLTQAQQELYRRHGINPLASMGGCLLLFAQLPVFMGLYFCLQENIFLRLAPFLWVRNLAAPDMLVWWSENIPLISTVADQGSFLYLGPYLNLLPILAVALMIVQQKLMTPPPTDEQQEIQQKMMKWMMVVFGIMFYKVAAGLCIYFIASSLWGVAERKLLPKSKPTGPAAADEEPASRPRNERKPEARSENGALQKLSVWWQDVLREAGKQQQARRETGGDERKQKRKRKRKGN
jgi:YidC/Oxa1 family membrane protein insertase